MAVYAYIRVSTEMQTLENQRFEIVRYCKSRNVRIDGWVSESVSGTTAIEKRGLGKLIDRMRKGDLLICTEAYPDKGSVWKKARKTPYFL